MTKLKNTLTNYAIKLADAGFSIIPVSEDKRPSGAWKKYQKENRTPEEVEALKSPLYGLVTGFNNLEVIDVDLKVFSSLKEQQDFWKEYTNFLKDNIDDFDLKFVIYKTVNRGYHILYKCKEVAGNSKIAKLKGQKECVIESRGVGGMVVMYHNQISELAYHEIKEISLEDRAILWEVSKSFNFIEQEIEQPKKVKKEYIETELTCWDDYNQKTNIFDIVQDEFKVVRQLNDKYIIKRFGATSVHSGYIYRDSGCMYLFSTGTNYPNEQLITPFAAYAYKFHLGDFSEAAKDLYNKGYGSRIMKVIEIEDLPEIKKNDLDFPIDVFPEFIQHYLIECNKTLDSSIDYMGCSMLWLTSVIVGNSVEIEVKKGWNEISTIWLAVVGKAGLGKTPSINNVIFPLNKINNKQIQEYIKQSEKFDIFNSLDKKEKEKTVEVKKPIKSQFIADDITIEALVDLHQESKNAVGVFKDELAGWFKDMNKYREGSDLQFWLSTWSGKSVKLNRKTAKSSFVDKPLIPVLGGIQPNILHSFYTEENKDNGFVDRMLLTYPDLQVELYNEEEMSQELLDAYNDNILALYEHFKNKVLQYNEDEIEPLTARFNQEAKEEWKRIFNNISNTQNSDDENEYMKSMLPKQKTYIPRFSLLLSVLNGFFNGNDNLLEITKEDVLKAEKLSHYFIAMAKKIKVNSIEVNQMKSLISDNKHKNNAEKVKSILKLNPDIKKSEIADLLGVSIQTVYKLIKKV